jgi:serralysin
MHLIKKFAMSLVALLVICSSPVSAMELEDDNDKLSYIATWPDLIRHLGANPAAGWAHFEGAGHAERRYMTPGFSSEDYLADNGDVASSCGFNVATVGNAGVLACGARHFIEFGLREGRSWSDLIALAYIASYPDLRNAFGSNAEAGRQHYLDHGKREGRVISFNIVAYVLARPNSFLKYRTNYEDALYDYIDNGGWLPN